MVLIFIWILALLIIWPFGEFPINDDFAYAKNVYYLAIEKKFVLDLWPVANVISQSIYGAIFTKIFGFSLVNLRLSTYILCVIASLCLKRVIENWQQEDSVLALFIVVVFFFNPLILQMSLTFMTDMFFISMFIFAFFFYKVISLQTNSHIIFFLFYFVFWQFFADKQD